MDSIPNDLALIEFSPAPAGWVNVYHPEDEDEYREACPGWLTLGIHGMQTPSRAYVTVPGSLLEGQIVPAYRLKGYMYTTFESQP